jgi:hypothetical protein
MPSRQHLFGPKIAFPAILRGRVSYWSKAVTMNVQRGAFLMSILFAAVSGAVEPPSIRPAAERVASRQFPSVFQAWNPIDSLKDEDRWTLLARHDLVFHAPDFFGLSWEGAHQGHSTTFTKESLEAGIETRKMLLAKNPNLIMLVELRYRDAHRSYLPEEHVWWRRKDGRRVVGWEEGGYFLLDFANPAYRHQVARQAKAVMDSDVFDGLMLDWWEDDEDRLALIKEIRKQIGDSPLVLVNANDRQTPKTGAFVNGYFMECYKTKTIEDWKQIAKTLEWAESNLKKPRINCLETWFHESRQDLPLMRATTTLSLTVSDGYCLFSDPNPLPTPDHLHDWYGFWDRSLGRPRAKGERKPDGSVQREFDRGLAVYNPPGNKSVIVDFKTPHTAVSSRTTAMTFTLPAGDGDLFLKADPK